MNPKRDRLGQRLRSAAQITRRSRALVLAVAAIALLAAQARYLPTRLAVVNDGWRVARMPDRDARLHAAIAPGIFGVLSRVQAEVPAGESILLVTQDAGTEPPYAPYVLYHRALYHLYPRRVWWAVVDPPKRVPAWWMTTSGSPDDVADLAEQLGAGALVTVGTPGRSPSGDGTGSAAQVEIRALGTSP